MFQGGRVDRALRALVSGKMFKVWCIRNLLDGDLVFDVYCEALVLGPGR